MSTIAGQLELLDKQRRVASDHAFNIHRLARSAKLAKFGAC